jgi:hypothetical protein
MATYSIKQGDSLSKIATANQTTVDALLTANKDNPSVKTKDLIIAGGSLNLPEAPKTETEVETPETPTNPAVPPTITTPDGFSASFFGDYGTRLKKLEEDTAKLFPTPEDEAKRLKEKQDVDTRDIQRRFKEVRGDIESQLATGEEEIQKGYDLLRTPDIQLKSRVDDYTSKVESFRSEISKSLENLADEEQIALDRNDVQYAEEIRNNRIEYINTQRQMLSDSFNFVSQAYNLMLSGKQEERQKKADEETRATNLLNTLFTSQKGKKWEEIPQSVKATIKEMAKTMKIPEAALAGLIPMLSEKTHFERVGNKLYVLDDQGNILKTVEGLGGGISMSDKDKDIFLDSGLNADEISDIESDIAIYGKNKVLDNLDSQLNKLLKSKEEETSADALKEIEAKIQDITNQKNAITRVYKGAVSLTRESISQLLNIQDSWWKGTAEEQLNKIEAEVEKRRSVGFSEEDIAKDLISSDSVILENIK